MRKNIFLAVCGLFLLVLAVSVMADYNDKLVMRLRFDTDALDDMGNNNGTVYNAILDNAFKKQGTGSYYFDGSGDFINLTDQDFLNGWTNLTIAYWVYPTSTDYKISSATYDNYAGSNGFISFRGSSNSYSYVAKLITGGVENGVQVTDAYHANDWYLITMVYNGSKLAIYLNGTYKNSVAATGSVSSNALEIGGYAGYGPTYDFKGYIDDFVVYNRSLSSLEILNMFQQTYFPNGTSAVNAITINSPLNNSYYMNYTQDYVMINYTVNMTNYRNSTFSIFNNGTFMFSNLSTESQVYLSTNNLTTGVYFYNITAMNSSGDTISSETRRFTIYSIDAAMTSPVSDANYSRYMNFTYSFTTKPSNISYMSYNLYILNNDTSINASVANNTAADRYLVDLLNYGLQIEKKYYAYVIANDSKGYTRNISIPFYSATNALLNITAYNFTNQISSFTINVTNINTSTFTQYTTSSGYITLEVIKGDTYNVKIDPPTAYAIGEVNKTTTLTYDIINFSVLPSNAVNITIYDENFIRIYY